MRKPHFDTLLCILGLISIITGVFIVAIERSFSTIINCGVMVTVGLFLIITSIKQFGV